VNESFSTFFNLISPLFCLVNYSQYSPFHLSKYPIYSFYVDQWPVSCIPNPNIFPDRRTPRSSLSTFLHIGCLVHPFTCLKTWQYTLTFLTTSWRKPLASLSVPLQNPLMDQARRPPIPIYINSLQLLLFIQQSNHTKYLILCCNYYQQIN
jgi:hypothetical protein